MGLGFHQTAFDLVCNLCFICLVLIMFCVLCRDKARNSGRVTCRVCLEDFQTNTNILSEPIDVYNDWIDACESAN